MKFRKFEISSAPGHGASHRPPHLAQPHLAQTFSAPPRHFSSSSHDAPKLQHVSYSFRQGSHVACLWPPLKHSLNSKPSLHGGPSASDTQRQFLVFFIPFWDSHGTGMTSNESAHLEHSLCPLPEHPPNNARLFCAYTQGTNAARYRDSALVQSVSWTVTKNFSDGFVARCRVYTKHELDCTGVR